MARNTSPYLQWLHETGAKKQNKKHPSSLNCRCYPLEIHTDQMEMAHASQKNHLKDRSITQSPLMLTDSSSPLCFTSVTTSQSGTEAWQKCPTIPPQGCTSNRAECKWKCQALKVSVIREGPALQGLCYVKAALKHRKLLLLFFHNMSPFI